MLRKSIKHRRLLECERIIYKFVREITLDFEEMEKIENIVEKQLYGNDPVL